MALAVVTGLVAGTCLGPAAGPGAPLVCGSAGLLLAVIGAGWHAIGWPVCGRRVLTAVMVLACFLAGAGRGSFVEIEARRQACAAGDLSGEAFVSGTLRSGARHTWIEVTQVRPRRERRVRTLGRPLRLETPSLDGATVGAVAGHEVAGFVWIDPAAGPRLPGGWNRRRALAAAGMGGSAWPRGFLHLEVAAQDERSEDLPAAGSGERPEGAPGSGLDGPRERRPGWAVIGEAARGVQHWAQSRLLRAVPGPEGLFLSRFLLGRGGRNTATSTAEAMRDAGLGHFLSISGFHVGCVAAGLSLALATLRLPPRGRRLLLAAMLPFYALLTGGGAAAIRAAGVGVLWLLARVAGRRMAAETALLCVLAGALWQEPVAWRLPGVQLSYAVTWALVRCARGAMGPSRERARRRDRAGTVLSGAVTAQCAAWPLTLAHWGGASPLFLAANLLFAPLAVGGVFLAFCGVSIGSLPAFPAETAGRAIGAAIGGLAGPLEWMARACRLTPVGGGLNETVALGLALLVGASAGWRRVRGPVRLGLAVALACTAAVASGPGRAAGWLVMTDVGQGDAWWLVSGGQTCLIDTGPPPDAPGRHPRALTSVLGFLGRRRIDRLVLTHDDADHSGGLEELTQAGIPIGEVWVAAGGQISERTAGHLTVLTRSGTRIRQVAEGDRARLGEFLLRVLHPLPNAFGCEDRNAHSVVLEVELGGRRILLWADLPGERQMGLMDALPLGSVLAQSAAHHGSAESTPPEVFDTGEAGKATRLLLISVGGRNPFGHPAPRVLTAAGSAGWEVVRTDRDGTAFLRFAKEGWSLWTTRTGRRLAAPAGHS